MNRSTCSRILGGDLLHSLLLLLLAAHHLPEVIVKAGHVSLRFQMCPHQLCTVLCPQQAAAEASIDPASHCTAVL